MTEESAHGSTKSRYGTVCRIKRTELVVSVTCRLKKENNGHRTRPCDACSEVDQSGCLACPPVKREQSEGRLVML
jgi:hypothetical protein